MDEIHSTEYTLQVLCSMQNLFSLFGFDVDAFGIIYVLKFEIVSLQPSGPR